jgi:hypothetical protein
MGVIIPQNTDIIQLNQWLGDFSGTITWEIQDRKTALAIYSVM